MGTACLAYVCFKCIASTINFCGHDNMDFNMEHSQHCCSFSGAHYHETSFEESLLPSCSLHICFQCHLRHHQWHRLIFLWQLWIEREICFAWNEEKRVWCREMEWIW